MTTKEAVVVMERRVKEKDDLIHQYNELTKLIDFLKGRHIVKISFMGNSTGSEFDVGYSGDLIKESVLLNIKSQIDELSTQIARPINTPT